MATALFSHYTPHGFVIAADGRSSKEDGEVISESVQKIFQLGGPKRRLAYAMTGALELVGADGGIAVDLAEEIKGAANALSRRTFKNPHIFSSTLCAPILQKIRSAHKAGKIEKLPEGPAQLAGEQGHAIIRIVIAGYYDGVPVLTECRIAHHNQKIRDVAIISPTMDEPWRTGVPEVARGLITDPRFAVYATPLPHKLTDWIVVAKQFVAACGGPEAMEVNPKAAQTVGGRTLIATITPADGFRWVSGFEPLSKASMEI